MQVMLHWKGCIFKYNMQKVWKPHLQQKIHATHLEQHWVLKHSRFETKDVSDAEDHSGLALILPTSKTEKWQHQNAVSGTSSVSSETQIKPHFSSFSQTWHSFKVMVVFFSFFLSQHPINTHSYFVSTCLWRLLRTSAAFNSFSPQIEHSQLELCQTVLGVDCIQQSLWRGTLPHCSGFSFQ